MTTSNEPSVPISSTEQQSLPAQGGLSVLKAYLQSHLTTAVWNLCLLLGGVVFLLYFCSIGFAPDIDLKTFVPFLALAALTGAFLLIVLSIYLLAPAWTWVQATRGHNALKSPAWFAFPMFGFILGLFLIPPDRFGLRNRWWCVIVIWVVSLVVVPMLALFSRRARRLFSRLGLKLNPWGGDETQWKKIKTALVFFHGLLASLFLFGPVILAVDLAAEKNPDFGNYATMVIAALTAILFICLMNTISVAMAQEDDKQLSNATSGTSKLNRTGLLTRSLIPAGITVIGVFFLVGAWTLIPKAVMRMYKLGNLTDATLVLDEMGCAIVRQHGLQVVPYAADLKADTVPASTIRGCSLTPVTIRSRLGNSYYLEVSLNKDTSVLFTVPGQNVLSWAVNEPKKSRPSGSR